MKALMQERKRGGKKRRQLAENLLRVMTKRRKTMTVETTG